MSTITNDIYLKMIPRGPLRKLFGAIMDANLTQDFIDDLRNEQTVSMCYL